MKTILAVRWLVLVSILSALPAFAGGGGPTGGVVVGGPANATITGQGSPVTIINQTANQTVINWQQFSIGAGDLVKFVQPSASAIALNRVLSGSPTEIFGTLEANGRVFVINPNGIMVGAGGVVNTHGFLASALNLTDSAFLSGNYLFTGDSLAPVRNEGLIQALGGDIYLIGHSVQNNGLINAPQGTVGLAAGSAVQLSQAGSERISVLAGNPSATAATDTGVNNTGGINAASAELKAAGGNIYALAINNGGVVRASGIVNEGGHIYLRSAGGNIQNTGTLAAHNADGSGGAIVVDGGHNAAAPATVINSGVIDASGTTGGTVQMTGDDVGLFDNAVVDVSGTTGGGTALIGGGLHGADPAIQDAEHTFVSQNAAIKADAINRGNGGNIVVWSQVVTRDFGSLSARGGATGGNGGFAEVSSKGTLDFMGAVDLLAPAGKAGTLLLDPLTITISTGAAANITGFSGGTEAFASDSGLASVFHVNADGTTPGSSFAGVAGNIDLQATQDITVANTFNVQNETGNNNVNLTLQAGNNININAAVTTTGTGTITLSANDNGGGTASGSGMVSISAAGSLNTANQNITIIAHDLGIAGGGSITSGSGTVAIKPTSDVNQVDVGAQAHPNDFVLANSTLKIIDTTTGITIGDSTLNVPVVVNNLSALAYSFTPSITLNSLGNISTQGTAVTGGGNLTMNAGGSITVGGSGINANGIGAVGGNLDLVAAGSIIVNNGTSVTTVGDTGATAGFNGGNITLNGLGVNSGGTATIDTSGGAATTTTGGNAGTLTIISSAAVTAGALTANGGAGVTTGGNGGTMNISSATGITLNHSLSSAGGTGTTAGSGGVITLDSTAGGVNQSAGTITAGTLSLLGAGAFGIADAGNAVSSLSANVSGGALSYQNTGALSLQTVSDSGQTVTLTGDGTSALTQSGALTAGILDLNNWGPTVLNQANAFGVLSVTGAGGSFQFTDTTTLDVQGIVDSGQTVTLTGIGTPTMTESAGFINAGELDLNNWGATTLNQVNTVAVLKAAGAAGALQFTDGQNLDARGIADAGQTVTLTGNGSPTLGQTAGTIAANELDLNNWAATTLNRGNTVSVLKVTGASGALQFTDGVNLDVQNLSDTGQNVTLTGSASPNPTLSQSAGAIQASQLTLNNWGATTLNQNNSVGVLKVAGATGALQFTDGVNLDAQGIADAGQTITLTGGGANTLKETTGTITASQLNVNTWGAVTLNQANQIAALSGTGLAGAFQLTDAANLNVVSLTDGGQTVTLTGSGTPTLNQTGAISAATLNLNNWGATTLNGLNSVATLGVVGAAGALQFTDGASLNVSGIGASGQNVTLTGSALSPSLNQSGAITANQLTLRSWGATTLNSANQVAILNATETTAFQFTDAANLDVQGLSDSGQTVTLTGNSTPTLKQTAGVINANELDLHNWGATTLNQPNVVNILKATGAAGALQFSDSVNLDVQGIADAGQAVTLTGITSPTLGQSTGIITAGQLNLNNWSAITFNQANAVGILTSAGGTGALQFTDAVNLDVQGITDPLETVTLTGSGGPTLKETTGVITAGALDLNNWGATTLNQLNQVGTLGVAGPTGAFQFTDAQSLTLNGISDPGQVVTVDVIGDNNQLSLPAVDNITGKNVSLGADRITLAGTLTATGVAAIHESTAGRVITLGTDDVNAPTGSGGTLGLTTSELNNITAGTVRIGDLNSGSLVVTTPIAPAGTSTLSLLSGGNISQNAGAAITVNNLAAQAGGLLSLSTPNAVGTLAATSIGPLAYVSLGSMTVGSVDGVNGVSSATGLAEMLLDSPGDVLTIGPTGNVSGPGGVLLIADDMVINGHINSGAGNTTLLEFSAGHPINLGPSVVAGDLNLSQNELNEVTANVLQIGNTAAGPVSGANLVAAPITVHKLVITGGAGSVTLLSQQLAALSAVQIPAPKLDLAQFSSAALSLDEASKILPAGSIGTIWLQLPFPPRKEKTFKVEDISKWTSGQVAAVGTTTGPQTPR